MFGPINLVSHLILIYFRYKHIRRRDPTSKHWFLKHFKIKPPYDKTNKMTVRPAKTQISLGIRPVWSESSLCAQWVAQKPKLSSCGQRRLRSDWADAQAYLSLRWGAHIILLVLSWGGSIVPTSMIFRQIKVHKLSHHMRLWHFPSCVNSFFKRACAVIQWGWMSDFFVGPGFRLLPYFMCANSEGSFKRLQKKTKDNFKILFWLPQTFNTNYRTGSAIGALWRCNAGENWSVAYIWWVFGLLKCQLHTRKMIIIHLRLS